MLKKYDITCRFCGLKTGEITVPDNFNFTEIADSRCDTHEQEFGNYREMEIFYERISNDGKFKDEVKNAEYKISKFVRNLYDKFPEKMVQTHYGKFEEEKNNYEKELNIDNLSIKEKLKNKQKEGII